MRLAYEALEAKLHETEARLQRTEELLKITLEKVSQLEEQLKINSKNSSKPPFYNLVRPNYSKGARTPWLIAQADHPHSDIASTVQFTTLLDLENLLTQNLCGGQPLPSLPGEIMVQCP